MTQPTAQPPEPSTHAEGVRRTSHFLPGTVFAGRYRMIAHLGSGGMGEVWRADDLVLQTPVALKLIASASPRARDRILNEVRLARQVTHPAICRVFDVGEADGELFYSMELVEGEDLATLVRRLGRLPPGKVLDIARQLAAGLAAAHARGVLHRDLKPANVLIDQDGRVRITDFGIAVTRDDTGDPAPIGTPGYMAPEQLQPGLPLTERTDVYALGVVLYEVLVGQPPFRVPRGKSGQLPKPSTLVSDVDPALERVVMQALALEPRKRPPSASDVLALLPEQTATAAAAAPSRRRPWLIPAVIVALLAVGLVAVVASLLLRVAPALTDQDVIVLAEFMNTTGDPVFDRTLNVALAVALEQSPFLKMISDDQVRETLQLMERPADERLTREVAREIARRDQLKVLIAGSIGSLGNNYVLTLEAISADTGEVVAREQAEARAKEEVLAALGTAAGSLREKLGESLASIARFDVPLPRATTGSLEALNAYALALDRGRVVPRAEAVPYLERAIALDPEFAMALAALSGVYRNTGRTSDAPPLARRAFDLRDRVSERERFFISWRYYLDAEQAWDKALELALSWTQTYPREAFAFNSLGLASGAFGQHQRAVEAFREAIRLDPEFVPPHGNLAGSLIALNQFDEARRTLREAARRDVAFVSVRRMWYLLALLDGDPAAAADELQLTRSTPDAVWAVVWEAWGAVSDGRFQAAHDLFQRGIQTADAEGLRELAAQWTMEDAEAHAIAGQCVEALREVAAGLERGRDNFTLERAARASALCGDAAGAARLSSELGSRFPTATLVGRVHLPVVAAAVAIQQRQGARALDALERVRPYDGAPAAELWPAFLRGQALLLTGDGPAAIEQFQRVIDARGQAPTSPFQALAHLGAARAAAMMDDIDRARELYARFLTLWNGADPRLPVLAEARRESARLQ